MTLTVAQLGAAKLLPEQFLLKCGLYDGEVSANGKTYKGVVIPYHTTEGLPGGRLRIRTHAIAKEGSFWADGDAPLMPYGLDRSNGATETILVEGESDCWTLWHHDIFALGIPGASMTRVLRAEYLANVSSVWISHERDDAGGKFVEAVRKQLWVIGFQGGIFELAMPAPYKDPHALYAAKPEAFASQIAALKRDAPPVAPFEPERMRKRVRKKTTSFLTKMLDGVELFCDPSGTEYCTIKHNGHNETARVRSGAIRKWIRRAYYEQHDEALGAQALEEVLGILESRALFDNVVRQVYVRFACVSDVIWVDLGDDSWQAVRIDPNGWRVVDNPGVRFRRTRGMQALPRPEAGGSIAELRPYLNLSDEESFILVCSWLIGAMNPNVPHPILVLFGEQGSCKSTASRILRLLLDPNTSPLRSEPKDPRDLMIAANNGWVIVLDNLSHLAAWLSDCLCRLSTGGGFSTRQLFTDDEEVIFEARRPILTNGIEEVATRPDLLDRTMSINVPSLPEDQRVTETELLERFAVDQPRILGALFDAVASALRKLPQVRKLTKPLPRMADFALWATAAEEALGFPAGGFIGAYRRNRRELNTLALDSSPIGAAVLKLMESIDSWLGTATELLSDLGKLLPNESSAHNRVWPKNGKGLSDALRRIASNLRQAGIDVTFSRTDKLRVVGLKRIGKTASSASGAP